MLVKLDKVEVQVIKEASTALNLYQDGQARRCRVDRGVSTTNGK